MKSSLWRRVDCAPSAPPSVATFPLEESEKQQGRTGQMATISKCRYRWLRVHATTFVIAHSPSLSNRRDGLGFSGKRGGGRWRRPGKVQRYHVHPEWRGTPDDDQCNIYSVCLFLLYGPT